MSFGVQGMCERQGQRWQELRRGSGVRGRAAKGEGVQQIRMDSKMLRELPTHSDRTSFADGLGKYIGTERGRGRISHLAKDGCWRGPLGLSQLPVPLDDVRQGGSSHEAAQGQRHRHCKHLQMGAIQQCMYEPEVCLVIRHWLSAVVAMGSRIGSARLVGNKSA